MAEAEAAMGAEIEAATAELAAAAAEEIMSLDPEITPEEAQALGEELVADAVAAELDEAAGAEEPMMEQTASDIPMDEAVVEEATGENFEQALADAATELADAAKEEIMALDPSIDEQSATELADELVAGRIAEVFGGEESEVPAEVPAEAEMALDNELLSEAEAVVDEVIMATAQDIKASAPELSDEDAIVAAEEAVTDALDTLQEQVAISQVDETGAPVVPDEVAADSVEDMIKTASANPLRDVLTPIFANLFNIDQTAFIERLNG
jgi:hypothetical protein